MREGHYPACFKVARVVPVFKGKGEDPTEYSGYRPVSVLPVLSQLFGWVVGAAGELPGEAVLVCGAWGL